MELGTKKTQYSGYRKIVSQMCMSFGSRKWQFFGKFPNGKTILHRMFSLFKLRSHKLIAGKKNAFAPYWDKYILK